MTGGHCGKVPEGLMSEPVYLKHVQYRVFDDSKAIRSVFSDALISPGFCRGNGFPPLSSPLNRCILLSSDSHESTDRRIHGTNERVRVANFREGVAFIALFLRTAGEGNALPYCVQCALLFETDLTPVSTCSNVVERWFPMMGSCTLETPTWIDPDQSQDRTRVLDIMSAEDTGRTQSLLRREGEGSEYNSVADLQR